MLIRRLLTVKIQEKKPKYIELISPLLFLSNSLQNKYITITKMGVITLFYSMKKPLM
ncbi:hypothetical protein PAUR_a2417 [Pseudoalteromonas aurantia 208]|uniref:Uncharacterized protein n=1 Tax=Pseudoalteromonas aurantia 208 TaxID=1314867 RepID=A0ABR9ED44_9GAMM|nr:hypothetical protein [Pseudoalteromonas aurantia 208]